MRAKGLLLTAVGHGGQLRIICQLQLHAECQPRHCLVPCLQCSVYSCRLSGPQGLVEPLTIIDDPADWRSQDLKPEDYTYRLTETEVAEIIAATDSILARGVKDEEDIKKVCWGCHS